MKLFLLRHETAEDHALAKSDHARKLTGKGKTNAFNRATKFRDKLDKVDVIVTSTAARALETAEIYAQVLGKSKELVKSDAFTPDKRVRDVMKALGDFKNYGEIILVGHGPWIEQLISLFICGTPDANIRMKKGALARIDISKFAPSGGELVWMR